MQKLQTQLDQYTDLTAEQEESIQSILAKDELNAFRGVYLRTADDLRRSNAKVGGNQPSPTVDQLDFEFVLFASAS